MPPLAQVLPGEDSHGVPEVSYCGFPVLAGAASLEMGYPDIMKVIVIESCLPDASAEVNILTVHEEGGIKQAGFFQGFSPDKHESAGEDVCATGLVLRHVPQIVCIEEG